jgi:hypothetical protein
MTFSALLLSGSVNRTVWFETGSRMIAIDTLVHNFLHRTGILQVCGATHPYGVGCYGPGGCAAIIQSVSSLINASRFNASFPSFFPIWRFCAADGLDLCNGNRIDDRDRCQISYCQLFQSCGRKQLKT